ncbi:MAG TPA: LOG family protein [Candidatus Xenobia bacterium]|jgi:hypothetical protein
MSDKPYSTGNPAVDEAIARLVEQVPNHDALLGEMITTAVKLVSDGADRGEMKLVNTTLKEMRHTFRVFRPYREIRKVSIFGSARVAVDTPVYQQAVEVARELALRHCMVVTGAGGGIMRAGHEGAGPDASFGVNIRLPFEQEANDIIAGNPRLINYKYFFTRKLAFIKETDAVVVLPGGFGTHDEGFESITLVQTGKSRIMPIIFLDAPGGLFWKAFDSYVREQLLGQGLISAADLSLYHVTDSAVEAAQVVETFYRRYHSMRYVGESLVVRLNPPRVEGLVQHINESFRDILRADAVESAPLHAEADEPSLAHLPRLLLRFDRRHFGRLRQLIDSINNFQA